MNMRALLHTQKRKEIKAHLFFLIRAVRETMERDIIKQPKRMAHPTSCLLCGVVLRHSSARRDFAAYYLAMPYYFNLDGNELV